MDDYEHSCYKEAGCIASLARKKGIQLIKPGVRLLDVAEDVESYIKDNAEIAFPVNISINDVVAHYTPDSKDESTFQRGDVVKFDVGVHVDGYIGDTAETIEVDGNDHSRLIEASKEALTNSINALSIGATTKMPAISSELTIRNYGFSPIQGLSGHQLNRYVIHGGIHVPFAQGRLYEFVKTDYVLAIEPFASTQSGIIKNNGDSHIFDRIRGRKTGLCLSERDKGARKGKKYPRLVEVNGGVVSQAEHTVIMEKDGTKTITTL